MALPFFGFMDFPGGSDGKESAYNAGDLGLIPGSGRFPGAAAAAAKSLQSCPTLCDPIDGSPGNGNSLHLASILAWKIPWMEEPGGL